MKPQLLALAGGADSIAGFASRACSFFALVLQLSG